ncbi:Poly(3-hydroxyalkanoate) polymerase subunit PhaC [Paraburkholderia hiiakae]|uniref:Poly(3-hydroxyalkanoate) polymerase subunit PhaC n=1 Tax=Paraburkholderia hiiakae TaxID=1081782 RepID=A0ABN7I319_9BURK|nr:class I poly(R)-hydroxyalkanoic acid synthase [Paraburkholderia hiiakae]CAD6550643.1 Poly(3-hydroxyalkanoate) polymerase subunit PhaC [Paraburkholderia hiiakae]
MVDIDTLFSGVRLASQYYHEHMTLGMRMFGGSNRDPAVPVDKGDRRFNAPQWKEYPLFDYISQSYRQTSKALLDAIELARLDETTKQKMRFYTRQYIDAISPTNFAVTNPEVLALAAETKGVSLANGLNNLMQDLKKGRISLSRDTAFEVGGNLANTPGAVVYENELIQLIQYSPATSEVKEIPLLVVPSVVNKYYILDLTAETSLVRYLVSQGFTVFIVSWRNINVSLQGKSWDDYVDQGVLKAIDVTREISGQDQINAAGYCVGGALLSSALAVRAAQGEWPVASMTLLMAMLEFSDPGEIGVYLDPTIIAQREAMYANGGVVSGKELTMAFSSLRANDLIWSFVVNNYLKGKAPDPFDLFYWNTDDSNLPGPMFSYYLRHCYIENKLVQPDALSMCGSSVDLRRINIPTYIFGASEDHLVPWKSGYESVNHLTGDLEFVLGGGGHITGPINPVTKNKRNYWTGGQIGESAEDWLASARSVSGSWWPHWAAWLERRAGSTISAGQELGSRAYREIEPAPGRYVKGHVH